MSRCKLQKAEKIIKWMGKGSISGKNVIFRALVEGSFNLTIFEISNFLIDVKNHTGNHLLEL